MARMATFAISISGTAYSLYEQAIGMSNKGLIPKEEVNRTLRDLVYKAKMNRNELFLIEHLPKSPKWNEINYYLIAGWLTHRETRAALEQLIALRRHLPIPERAKVNWPKPRPRHNYGGEDGVVQ